MQGRTELDYLAVDPWHQRCGVASKLLESELEQARRLQLVCFAMATSRDWEKLYDKHGSEYLHAFGHSLGPWGSTETADNHFLIKRPAE
ncbi:unnamed protein product [Zymoseptoria tritici ST99CH_3D1]|uniref:N-acetyltransferase domain-containing protein n=2 Tax=Zymoseptoria tritici TaxID=1047171 RepID=A0A1X7S4Z9_ZYMT9|nr:unnamed protein product [Zymoseptoria tritici ST99CH_3D7]SMR59028.1 unnamed protein product [Zymoseptoria tritici ST99CH_1E4]SMR62870.1 unnamed protein product [Zymoseptoria tritici ST99CH_3D1]